MVGYKLRFCQKLYLAIKSFLDFLFALIGIIILTPLFLIVAIAIKIDSKGPVFFLQKRIGKNGKLFNCIKFRSMAKDAKHNVSTADFGEVQCYVTRVGKFIRKCSIDELPQLFNVLFFKMSLIGYRPIIPYEKELDEYRTKYSVYDIKPGITGWAQVNGRDLLSDKPEYKAQLDNYYKNRRARRGDFWICNIVLR
jgi:O-antigen biosynthesis protein WbqP